MRDIDEENHAGPLNCCSDKGSFSEKTVAETGKICYYLRMLNNEIVMDWKLFGKIDMDVENGMDKKECIEKWSKNVIEEYERFGEENDVFEGDWDGN